MRSTRSRRRSSSNAGQRAESVSAKPMMAVSGVRSSCDTVERKSDFMRSTSRNLRAASRSRS